MKFQPFSFQEEKLQMNLLRHADGSVFENSDRYSSPSPVKKSAQPQTENQTLS
jgi:hypothetical protein